MEGGILPTGSSCENDHGEDGNHYGETRSGWSFSVSKILFIIYIGGVLYFFARFVYLVIRLYLLAKRNGISRQDGFRMVEIEEEISPFSFFRFLFIHNGSFNDVELVHVLEHETMLYRLGMRLKEEGNLMLTFDGRPIQLSGLPGLVKKKMGQLSKTDQLRFTTLFLIDRSVSMAGVDRVRNELRQMEVLHFAEGGYPQGDLELSPLIYQAVALPRILPPTGVKRLDKKEVESKGGNLYPIDLSERNTTPRDIDEGLRKFIGSIDDGKYVISLEYDGEIPYGQYAETVDMIWMIVYSFRNTLAMERYSVPYEKLGDDLQSEIKKAYPMAVSEMMKN